MVRGFLSHNITTPMPMPMPMPHAIVTNQPYVHPVHVFRMLFACVLLSACSSSPSTGERVTSETDVGTQTRSCRVSLPETGSFTDDYHLETVCGWTVQVSRELFENTLADDVFNAVNSDLKMIESVLPESAATGLKQVTIWLELNQSDFPGGVYHPSSEWLVNNGYPSKWAKGVQLGVAQNYLTWTNEQPAMLLHELAHAYDDVAFASAQPDLLAAYDTALLSGTYDLVEYVNGGTQRAYALTNAREYFAELTEAYFWRNDFYPFDRQQLLAHDPLGYNTIEIMWLP